MKHYVSKPKKMPPTRRHVLEKELDDLVSLIVRLRDGDCITPDKGSKCYGNLTCSHFYKRERMKIRWDLRNCNCQCSSHNNRHNFHTEYYDEYMLKKYPTSVLLELAQGAGLEHYKWNLQDLEDMLAQYQEIYLDLLAHKPSSTPSVTGLIQTKWL